MSLESGTARPDFIRTQRADAIIRASQLRHQAAREALEALEEVIREMLQAEEERGKKNLNPGGVAVFWLLEKEGIADAEVMAGIQKPFLGRTRIGDEFPPRSGTSGEGFTASC